MAENELSLLTRQCASGRRLGALTALQAELGAWSNEVNNTQRGVDRQMKISDARYKNEVPLRENQGLTGALVCYAPSAKNGNYAQFFVSHYPKPIANS
jgi:hypothetical protein